MVEVFAVLNLQPSVDKSEHVCTPPPSLLLSHQDRELLRQVCLLHLDAAPVLPRSYTLVSRCLYPRMMRIPGFLGHGACSTLYS